MQLWLFDPMYVFDVAQDTTSAGYTASIYETETKDSVIDDRATVLTDVSQTWNKLTFEVVETADNYLTGFKVTDIRPKIDPSPYYTDYTVSSGVGANVAYESYSTGVLQWSKEATDAGTVIYTLELIGEIDSSKLRLIFTGATVSPEIVNVSVENDDSIVERVLVLDELENIDPVAGDDLIQHISFNYYASNWGIDTKNMIALNDDNYSTTYTNTGRSSGRYLQLWLGPDETYVGSETSFAQTYDYESELYTANTSTYVDGYSYLWDSEYNIPWTTPIPTFTTGTPTGARSGTSTSGSYSIKMDPVDWSTVVFYELIDYEDAEPLNSVQMKTISTSNSTTTYGIMDLSSDMGSGTVNGASYTYTRTPGLVDGKEMYIIEVEFDAVISCAAVQFVYQDIANTEYAPAIAEVDIFLDPEFYVEVPKESTTYDLSDSVVVENAENESGDIAALTDGSTSTGYTFNGNPTFKISLAETGNVAWNALTITEDYNDYKNANGNISTIEKFNVYEIVRDEPVLLQSVDFTYFSAGSSSYYSWEKNQAGTAVNEELSIINLENNSYEGSSEIWIEIVQTSSDDPLTILEIQLEYDESILSGENYTLPDMGPAVDYAWSMFVNDPTWQTELGISSADSGLLIDSPVDGSNNLQLVVYDNPLPQDVSEFVEWGIADADYTDGVNGVATGVATIDQNGLVTATESGHIYVTATIKEEYLGETLISLGITDEERPYSIVYDCDAISVEAYEEYILPYARQGLTDLFVFDEENNVYTLQKTATQKIDIMPESTEGAEVFESDWEDLATNFESPDWYEDAKFGVYMHWLTVSVLEASQSEWLFARGSWQTSVTNSNVSDLYSRFATYYDEVSNIVNNQGDIIGYKDMMQYFSAENFDADQWAQLFADSGAKFVVPVATHHDTYALHDSTYLRYNTVDIYDYTTEYVDWYLEDYYNNYKVTGEYSNVYSLAELADAELAVDPADYDTYEAFRDAYEVEYGYMNSGVQLSGDDLTADLILELREAVYDIDGLYFGITNHYRENDSWLSNNETTAVEDFYNLQYSDIMNIAHLDDEDEGSDVYFVGNDIDFDFNEHMNMWYKVAVDEVDRIDPDFMLFDWLVTQTEYTSDFLTYFYNYPVINNDDIDSIYDEDYIQPIVTTKFETVDGAVVMGMERGQTDHIRENQWEANIAVGDNSWAYYDGESFKETNEIVQIFVDVVSKNGTMLMNFGPMADGTIPSEVQTILAEMGQWLDEESGYGEGIYATRAWTIFGEGVDGKVPEGAFGDMQELDETDFRFTQTNPESEGEQALYVFGFDNTDGTYDITSIGTETFDMTNVESVELLGSTGKIVSWSQDSEGFHITIEGIENFGSIEAWGFKITMEDGYEVPSYPLENHSITIVGGTTELSVLQTTDIENELVSINDYTRIGAYDAPDGYEFDQWVITSIGTNNEVSIDDTSRTMTYVRNATDDVTIEATYTRIDEEIETEGNLADGAAISGTSSVISAISEGPLKFGSLSTEEHNAIYQLSNLTDGKLSTQWAPGVLNAYATIDLGELTDVGIIVLDELMYNGLDYIVDGFNIAYSENGSYWFQTDYYDSMGSLTIELDEPVTARYIKLSITSTTTGDYARLSEMQIYVSPELTAAQEAAAAELSLYVDLDDYRTTDQIYISALITNVQATICETPTIAAIPSLIADAKVEIDKFSTDAELTAAELAVAIVDKVEALETAYAAIDLDTYTTLSQSMLKTELALQIASIQAKEAIADVEAIDAAEVIAAMIYGKATVDSEQGDDSTADDSSNNAATTEVIEAVQGVVGGYKEVAEESLATVLDDIVTAAATAKTEAELIDIIEQAEIISTAIVEAFDSEATEKSIDLDDSSTITVDKTESASVEKVVVTVGVTAAQEEAVTSQVGDDAEVVGSYTIKALDVNNSVVSGETVKINIQTAIDYEDGKDYTVYHDGVKISSEPTNVDGKVKLEFSTDSFSPFVVVSTPVVESTSSSSGITLGSQYTVGGSSSSYDSSTEEPEETVAPSVTETPATTVAPSATETPAATTAPVVTEAASSTSNAWIWIVVAVLAIGVIGFVVYKKKK